MFGGLSQKGESAQEAFARVTYELIAVRVYANHIYPVYDYFFHAANTIHYVFYAEVSTMPTFPLGSNTILSWFTFKQITKLALKDQTKHDIIISERVINAQARIKEKQHAVTIPSVYADVPLSSPVNT